MPTYHIFSNNFDAYTGFLEEAEEIYNDLVAQNLPARLYSETEDQEEFMEGFGPFPY